MLNPLKWKYEDQVALLVAAGFGALLGLINGYSPGHDDVVHYCFPKDWPDDREQRAAIIGEWLQTEARYLA